MIILGIFSKFLPKKKPVVIKNNIPKEKETIRKMFGTYCQNHHNPPSGKKLCPKCTALLATVMLKMNRCPYGITKPICDKCEIQCFGTTQTKEFMEIMKGARTKMFFKHPIMSLKHKFYGWRVDAAKAKEANDARKKAKKDK